jgi:hypothetical protein
MRVIGKLTTMQGKVKHASIEPEEKPTNLIAQGAEEIATT